MIHSDPTKRPRHPLEVPLVRMQRRLAQVSRRGPAWRGSSAHMLQCVSVPLERGTDCPRERLGLAVRETPERVPCEVGSRL